MSKSPTLAALPRRERELFELLVTAGRATAAELHDAMPDPPSYSAVRALLARLEGRGLIRRQRSRPSIQYAPVPQKAALREGALKSVVSTFFQGSPVAAATALLGMGRDLSPDEIETLQALIDRQREKDAA
ncbi:MAG: BlaI/MecI/CopY family transcriptional regulator [Pseudomonadota bacterium]